MTVRRSRKGTQQIKLEPIDESKIPEGEPYCPSCGVTLPDDSHPVTSYTPGLLARAPRR